MRQEYLLDNASAEKALYVFHRENIELQNDAAMTQSGLKITFLLIVFF